MTAAQLIQQAAELASVEMFVESYVKDAPLEQRQIEGLGLAIEEWAQGDEEKIRKIFAAALSEWE